MNASLKDINIIAASNIIIPFISTITQQKADLSRIQPQHRHIGLFSYNALHTIDSPRFIHCSQVICTTCKNHHSYITNSIRAVPYFILIYNRRLLYQPNYQGCYNSIQASYWKGCNYSFPQHITLPIDSCNHNRSQFHSQLISLISNNTMSPPGIQPRIITHPILEPSQE